MNMNYRFLKLCRLFGKIEIELNASPTCADDLVVAKIGGESGYGALPFGAIDDLHKQLREKMPKWDCPGKPAIEC